MYDGVFLKTVRENNNFATQSLANRTTLTR